MQTVSLRIFGTGMFFVVIFLSGIWLSSLGRPLNAFIFNIHKFVALGAIAFIAVIVYQINNQSQLTTLQVVLTAVAGLCFVITIIAGGLCSLDRTPSDVVLRMHQLMPFVTVAMSTVALCVLLNGET